MFPIEKAKTLKEAMNQGTAVENFNRQKPVEKNDIYVFLHRAFTRRNYFTA